MHVPPTNVIRFPALAAAAARPPVAWRAAAGAAADVVAFPPPTDPKSAVSTAQAHGSLFAADRIVTRVADALDRIPDL